MICVKSVFCTIISWINNVTDKEGENLNSQQEEDEYFKKFYNQWKGTKATDKDHSYKVIPKFYFKV